MSSKDRYGNNLRRMDIVNDLREGSKQKGTVESTSGPEIIVIWDDGTEEGVRGGDLVLSDQRFGKRRRG